MATLSGCVDLTTGKVVFAHTVYPACALCPDTTCNYSGCFNAATGQVEVIILTENCDDTYYGCVDNATGIFQLIVPNNCCLSDGQPETLTVFLTGLTGCDDCYAPEDGCPNDYKFTDFAYPSSITVTHTSGCAYEGHIEGDFGDMRVYSSDDASCDPFSYIAWAADEFWCNVSRSAAVMTVTCGIVTTSPIFFSGSVAVAENCYICNEAIDNTNVCSGYYNIGTGCAVDAFSENGNALVVPGDISCSGPSWDSGTSYVPCDMVTYASNCYICVVANLNDPPPSANWAEWT